MTQAITVTNRQYNLTGPRRGVIASAPLPTPGPNQALVHVRANGVCASDLATWQLGRHLDIPLGHEPVGQVVDAGPGMNLRDGTWVTGRIVASYADYAIAEAQDVVVVPDQLDPMLALGEPLGCVAEAHRRTRLRLGDHVAVVGLGFMGLLLMELIIKCPVASITAIDPRPDARSIALQRGASTACSPEDLLDQTGAGFGRSDGFDVVIEASGSQAGLDLATDLVAPHGTLSILGYHQGNRSVNVEAWNWKAIDIINAHVRNRDQLRESIRRGLEFAAFRSDVDLSTLITHRFNFDEVDTAFETLQNKPPGFVKAVLSL